MKNTELKEMRDKALYEVYVKCLSTGSFSSQIELAEHASKQPAPQFFIESHTLSLIFGMIESHYSLIGLNSMSRRRAWDLYANYQRWKEANPDSTLSRERICELLVDEPAPEFYMQSETARKIIQKMCKKKRNLLIA